MFTLWSSLNSSVSEQEVLAKSLDKYKNAFASSFPAYYKSKVTTSVGNSFKPNEKDLVKRIATKLELDEGFATELYQNYLGSVYNRFIVSNELLEKLSVDELFNAHFHRFVEFYHRERYSFCKNIFFIVTRAHENNEVSHHEDMDKNALLVQNTFKDQDLQTIYKSSFENYKEICKEIRALSDKKVDESLNEKIFVQYIKELELVLEIILVLTNQLDNSHEKLFSVVDDFIASSIVKYLESLSIHNAQLQTLVRQIAYLEALVLVRMLSLENGSLSEAADGTPQVTQHKTRLLNLDTKNKLNDLINSFSSNEESSPVILAWATMLFQVSNDPNLSKLVRPDLNSLINRMLAVAIKENAFKYLLGIFTQELFTNEETLWHIKQIIYQLVNVVLHSFDDNSFAKDLKMLYELCFFCMEKNEINCDRFWKACQSSDRDNITILLSYSLETFPINFGTTLTFFALIARTNPEFCKKVIDFLSQMNQYCEYFDLSPEDYASNGEQIRLKRKRYLFGNFELQPGQMGNILGGTNSACMAHKVILQSAAVDWTVNFNCFEYIRCNLDQINYLASTNDESLFEQKMIYPTLELIDSIFKHFFDIDEQEFELNSRTLQCNKHMENFVNCFFSLFTNLMNNQSPESYPLLAKLLELFNNISPHIYDKLIRLLQINQLIGHDDAFDRMNLQQLFNNRFKLINSSNKLLFIFKSQHQDLIKNYLKLVHSLIKVIGNNNQFITPLTCMLTYVFPHVFKWRATTFSNQLELLLCCLNLLHSSLNTSVSSFIPIDNQLNDDSVSNHVKIDEYCENLLLNTECSESLLQIIYATYEFSQDLQHSYEIKRLDSIQMQSVSLVNRLLTIPSTFSSNEEKDRLNYINQSMLLSNLISSLTKNRSQVSNGSFADYSIIQNTTNLGGDSSESNTTRDIINKNNQFLLQLNLLVSKTSSSSGDRDNLTPQLLIDIYDSANGINWFYLLAKMLIYKSNGVLDSLLFSIFRKISILTPRLFGSLLGPFSSQMHSIIYSKLSEQLDSRTICIISEFLSALVEYQPGFFQTLADIRSNRPAKVEPGVKQESGSTETFVEGDKSILKLLFTLLDKLTSIKDENPQGYFVSVSGIYNVFYTIWSNRKHDYIQYCKGKPEFWPKIAMNLNLIKAEMRKLKEDDELNAIDEFFVVNSRYELSSTDELTLEANVKCASYILKIFAIEIFDECYLKQTNQPDMIKFFQETIFDHKLIESWLDFYTKQLKRDLLDESRSFLSALELAEEQQRIIKSDLSLINLNACNKYSQARSPIEIKKLNSKVLFESIKTLLLLVNKLSRLSRPPANKKKSESIVSLPEQISIKKIKLNITLSLFVDSMTAIINYLHELNYQTMRVQQEQQQFYPDMETFSVSNMPIVAGRTGKSSNELHKNFITLKQSSDVIKQFHSLSNSLMILVTSQNDFEKPDSITKQLLTDLVNILEKALQDDFNYFPAIINNIQVSLLHVFTKTKLTGEQLIELIGSDKDDSRLKKLIASQSKLFSLVASNLDNEKNMNSTHFLDNSTTFILNLNITKFIIKKIDPEHWQSELIERCVVQCLYSLFKKFIMSNTNAKLVHAILDMLFTLGKHQSDYLIKSDFNSYTCLCVNKIFENSFLENNAQKKRPVCDKLDTGSWSAVLNLYFNIQALLLSNLKYKYLKDSTLFFGSYYDHMIQIIYQLKQTFDLNLLNTIRTICRYLSIICQYKKELIVYLSDNMDRLQQLFCHILQICINRLSSIKNAMAKYAQFVHNQQQQQQQSQPSLTNSQLEQHQQHMSNISSCYRSDYEDLQRVQIVLFEIISYCMDSLFNYVPNLGDFNYVSQFDEFKLLLTLQLSSTPDFQAGLSFGSLLWIIEYCLRVLQKQEMPSSTLNTTAPSATAVSTPGKSSLLSTPIKRAEETVANQTVLDSTSPRRLVTFLSGEETGIDSKQPSKALVTTVLEKLLNLLLTQIILCDKLMQHSDRDRKLFKRELSTEINQIISGLNRTFKRTTSSHPTKSPTAGLLAAGGGQQQLNLMGSSKQTNEFFKLIQNFLIHTID